MNNQQRISLKDVDRILITKVRNGWTISLHEEQTQYKVVPLQVAETQESLLQQIKEITSGNSDGKESS